ncbi:MAG TPA: hypothetical protein VIL97_08095 [Thermoanaerobaculia bacterium]
MDSARPSVVFGLVTTVVLASAALASGDDWSAFGSVDSQASICTPAKLGVYSFKNSNFPRNITMKGDVVYVATSGPVDLSNYETFNFRAIDISNKSAPALRGATVLLGELGPKPPIELARDHAYVTSSLGLYLVESSNPTGLMKATLFEVPGIVPENVRVSGSKAYVIGKERNTNRFRLAIVDVGAPSVPVHLGSFQVDGSSDFDFNWRDLEVIGNVIYVGAPALVGEGGAIRAIDASNPSAPREVGRLTDANIYYHQLATNGTHLLVAGNRHLLVIDVANPATMKLIAKIETGGRQVEDLDVIGGLALVADVVLDKVFMFDLSKTPQVTQSGTISADAYRISADGRFAAIILYNDEALSLYDIGSCVPSAKRRRAARR